jgi:hypothetical protein
VSSPIEPEAALPSDRLVSLDQFRGYTVAGMFLVNFATSYAAVASFLPTLKHWNNYCSYADTIMPQFLFAVGFGFRMSYLKRRDKLGTRLANWRVVRRILGLLLVALIVHGLDGNYRSWSELAELGVGGFFQTSFQRSYFQTLAHIGLTSLWVVPVLGTAVLPRLIYMVLSGILFVLLSHSWYYEWVMTRPGIDGGPLGFLTWTSSLMLGTFAYDLWAGGGRHYVLKMFGFGCLAMAAAYGISCVSMVSFPNQFSAGESWKNYFADNPFSRPLSPQIDQSPTEPQLTWKQALTVSGKDIPPSPKQLVHWAPERQAALKKLIAAGQLPEGATATLVPLEAWHDPQARYLNQWTMSQRAGSWSYTLFGSGFAMALLAIMVVLCDRWGWQLGMFRTLGVNALIGYILHGMVNDALKPFIPGDAPLWYVIVGFSVSFGICYLVLRTIEKQKIFFRL